MTATRSNHMHGHTTVEQKRFMCSPEIVKPQPRKAQLFGPAGKADRLHPLGVAASKNRRYALVASETSARIRVV